MDYTALFHGHMDDYKTKFQEKYDVKWEYSNQKLIDGYNIFVKERNEYLQMRLREAEKMRMLSPPRSRKKKRENYTN